MHTSTRNYRFPKDKQLGIPFLREKVKIKDVSKIGDQFLSNADTKIVSIALTKCIGSILPDLIHQNQNALLKGEQSFM